MSDWTTGLVLEQGEALQTHWKGDTQIEDRIAVKGSFGKMRTQSVQTKKDGILALTNQQLIWLTESGRFGKSYHAGFSLPLEEVQGISRGGSLHKFVTITGRQARYMFHLDGVGNDDEFEQFSKWVLGSRENRISVLRQRDEASKIHFQNVLITCKYCGHREPQGTLKCSNCGAGL